MSEQEELLWYQKSRLDFIKDGDRNTKFFQVSTLIRRWQNQIDSLKNCDGIWVTDKEAVKELVVSYFQRLYTAEIQSNEAALITLPFGIFQDLRKEEYDRLASSFTQAEIELALAEMNELKAPGSDGFQALFYKKNWDLLAPTLVPMVIKALEGKGFPEGLDDTHIVVIPKTNNPEYITQSRPIGLCNVSYKLISKVLANRLKKILPHFISETQSGFVPEEADYRYCYIPGVHSYHA